ncbi:MAG: PASTA domain-containing protein [Clostridia bacterium]|nr:PASTA domain-containing protein [Clostridia bacterium]
MLNTEGLCLGCMSDNGGERVCPICGFDNSTANPKECLPLKSVVANRYIVGRMLEADGEGITYIGWDNSKMSKIKIKEYFPKGFAHRNPDKTVSIGADGKYTFNEGLLEFLEINRAIILSTLPSLPPIYDTFEENGTAYAVCEYIVGITLEEFLIKNGGSLKWEQARPLFLPLIDTVEGMNEIGYIHGGISPDTVIVGRDGKLRLSKYSIKKLRRSNSELENYIYDGFAALEQYGVDELYNDTFTDVYGLCAVLFRVLIGTVPPVATDRVNSDVMTIPAHFAEELPHQVLAALANGLQVFPKNRTKNIEILKNELVYGEIEKPAAVEKKPVTEKNTPPQKKKNSSAKYVLISALCTVLVFALVAVLLIFTVFKDSVFGNEENSSAQSVVSFIEPEVDSIGDVDSDADVTTKLYPIPNLSGIYFSEVIDNSNWEMFEFVLTDKAYSNDYPKGTICAQNLKAGTEAARDTKIEVTISLGPKEISIANLKGYTEQEAKLELLKQGFLYENIKVMEKYDEDSEPATVLKQLPEYGEKVNTEVVVEIYINSYKGETSLSNTTIRN